MLADVPPCKVLTPQDFNDWQSSSPRGFVPVTDAGHDVLPSGELVELYLLGDDSSLAVVHCSTITPEIGVEVGALLNTLRTSGDDSRR